MIALVVAQDSDRPEADALVAADRGCVGGGGIDHKAMMAALGDQMASKDGNRLAAEAAAVVFGREEEVDAGVAVARRVLLPVLDQPGKLALDADRELDGFFVGVVWAVECVGWPPAGDRRLEQDLAQARKVTGIERSQMNAFAVEHVLIVGCAVMEGSAADTTGAEAARMLASVQRDGETDRVAIEEPLEIRVDGTALAVTMRTPGHDEELALGFLLGEGLIDGPRPVGLSAEMAANTIEVSGPLLRTPSPRNFYATSSCGVCGKGALEEVAVHAPMLPAGPTLARELIADLPERVAQPAFDRSGGLHAAGLFDSAGELLCAREDVGRHNALDKVIGWALGEGMVPLAGNALCVSGRLAFELVQKTAIAGAPILVGVGAPTSLAIELARDRGMTLCGFARGGHVNVYTGEQRLR